MPDPFATFPIEREEGLKKLYRYGAFDVLFYRPSLWTHTHRVSWLVEELSPVAKKHFPKFDAEKARILALVHDDAELITGDIMSRTKARASKAAVRKMHDDEFRAIQVLAKRYPRTVAGYSYKKLLTEAFDRTSIEAQVVTYADKLDAYCEGLHEVLAGNLSLLQCTLFYPKVLALMDRKFPKLKPFLEDKSSILLDLERFLDAPLVRSRDYEKFKKPFTKRTIMLPSVFPFYDRWREIILERGGRDGLRMLTKQLEFLPQEA